MEETLQLKQDLNKIAELLRKYRHSGQARVVGEILATLETSSPDYKRLAGIDMWGGAGAVWEANLGSHRSEEERLDRRAYFEAFIRLGKTMDDLGIGTARSKHIGMTFQTWLDNDL